MNGNTHIKRYLFLLCVFFVVPQLSVASESIEKYEINIEIHNDATLRIMETITYDFGENSKRGIFREIPIKYNTTAGNRGINIDVISVSRNGYDEPYSDKEKGKNKVIRIGDEDVYIEGTHTYRITYSVFGALNSFEDFDELYWNVIGNDWNIPIHNISAYVQAPADVVSADCFNGLYGAQNLCNSVLIKDTRVVADTAALNARESMTVVVALPKGAVQMPTFLDLLWVWIKSNLIVFVPLFVFALMYRIWDEKGRDAKGRGTIIPEYKPPQGISPLFMGAIIDGSLQNHDISAGIIYLAEQGFLTISREEKKRFLSNKIDYTLSWVGNYEELNQKEQLIAELIFGINVHEGQQTTLSALQKDSGVTMRRQRLSKHIDEDLMAQGYFANKPGATKLKWTIIPIIVLVIFAQFIDALTLNVTFIISIILSLLTIIVFGNLMPKLTRKGALAREQILGFKKYISVTEKDRYAFHNAPERTTKEFMTYLPFAIALGLEEKWAEQFKNIEMTKPEWYMSNSGGHFNSTAFSKDITSFSDSMSSGVTASKGGSGSGGGGFSGGGMGGGGGGSW